MEKIKWSKMGGYECSSIGDKRFSALFATLPDGRTIEQHYQCDVKGYDVGGTSWRLGKGKPPLDKTTDLWSGYLILWTLWAVMNEDLLDELYEKALEHNNTLSDFFAAGGEDSVNQARALAEVLNSYKGRMAWAVMH